MDRRRKYVMTLIEMGWSDKYDLLQIVKKNTNWQVTDRQIYTYIAGCFKILQNRAQQDADRIFGIIWLRLESTYREAVKKEAWTVAIDALQEMAKLAGIYHPSKFSLTDPTGTKDYGERFAKISFIESALRASPETQDKLVELLAEISERRAADEPGRPGAN